MQSCDTGVGGASKSQGESVSDFLLRGEGVIGGVGSKLLFVLTTLPPFFFGKGVVEAGVETSGRP